MIIIGAGLAGLLAGAMLRNECSCIIEKQAELPNNHSALLRFRTSIVGDALNIRFREVNVLKDVLRGSNHIQDALFYSRKTTGTYTFRSILNTSPQIVKRWIAPDDLVAQMADRVMGDILLGRFAKTKDLAAYNWPKEKVISTLPMPVLMEELGWTEIPDFKYIEGYNVNAVVKDCDAYATLYVPEPNKYFSRISLTGNKLTVEYQYPDRYWETEEHSEEEQEKFVRSDVGVAAQLLGLEDKDIGEIKGSVQKYAKILPIDENIRRRFILWATEQFGIYSLGRFATWRPGLLLDDLVNDVRVIMNIERNGTYNARRS